MEKQSTKSVEKADDKFFNPQCRLKLYQTPNISAYKIFKSINRMGIHAKMRSGHSATEWGAYGQEWLKMDGNCDAVCDKRGQI